MGTGIHIKVERLLDGKWQYVEPPRTFGGGDWRTWDDQGNDPNALRPEGRNYSLFAFLADVRNGFGFAGTYSHERITPQFPNRGIPDDSDHANSEDFWPGDHSFTWATLTELLAAPWDVVFNQMGYVKEEVYEKLRQNECPQIWCNMVTGKDIVHLTPSQYENMKQNDTSDPEKKYYVIHQWEWQPLKDCDFKRWLERDLVPIANGDTDTVRVIMGFDS